jgi:hypothetical protein
MTRLEDNAWYLLVGILMGMVLCFWFCQDIDFFRREWPAIMGALIVWAFVRRGKNDDKCGEVCRDGKGSQKQVPEQKQ